MKFFAALTFSDPLHFVEVARTADVCGIDGVAISDHVLYPEHLTSPYPYTPDGLPGFEPSTPWPDPWVAIGAMAAVTTRLRFLTNVYVLPARNPFVVAKTVGTAAVLSQNRVIFGIGVGLDARGVRAARSGIPHPWQAHRRGDRRAARALARWRGGMVEHHGRFCDFDRIQMGPAPAAPIPIYVGGVSEPALRRAARFGDGWISVLHSFRGSILGNGCLPPYRRGPAQRASSAPSRCRWTSTCAPSSPPATDAASRRRSGNGCMRSTRMRRRRRRRMPTASAPGSPTCVPAATAPRCRRSTTWLDSRRRASMTGAPRTSSPSAAAAEVRERLPPGRQRGGALQSHQPRHPLRRPDPGSHALCQTSHRIHQ